MPTKTDFVIYNKIKEEICENGKYYEMKNYKAHGSVSVYSHSIAVAKRAYVFAIKHKIRCDLESLVKGALLHDYYLYDWHENPKFTFHGFTHAKTAAKNASRDYALGKKEINIIESHMFPLNPFALPKCKEAWIVSFADKIQAIKETFGKTV